MRKISDYSFLFVDVDLFLLPMRTRSLSDCKPKYMPDDATLRFEHVDSSRHSSRNVKHGSKSLTRVLIRYEDKIHIFTTQ